MDCYSTSGSATIRTDAVQSGSNVLPRSCIRFAGKFPGKRMRTYEREM